MVYIHSVEPTSYPSVLEIYTMVISLGLGHARSQLYAHILTS